MNAPKDFKPNQIWECHNDGTYPPQKYLIQEANHENYYVYATWIDTGFAQRKSIIATGKLGYFTMFVGDRYVRDLTPLELELL